MLDPAARALLDFIESRNIPAYETLTPQEARAFYRDRRAVTQPDPPEVALARDLAADAPFGRVPLRLYRPFGAPADAVLPVLVYFHGGGWTIGDLETHDVLCRQLCNASGVSIVSVDYRLGPEHKFPAAVDDAIAATHWVARNAVQLNVDAGRLAVGGDSAGGNLAAVVALTARDAGGPPIRFQLLIYPGTDMRCSTPSHEINGEGYLLTASVIRWFKGNYLGSEAEQLDWRASPLLAPDLSRLPPALVLSAGFDPLRDECLLYADALSKAGSASAYVCFERQIHGFITMGRVLPEANAAVSLCAAELRRALYG